MLVLAWIARVLPGWRRLTTWSPVAAIGVSASGLTFMAAPESIQGLVQHCIYFFALSWLVLTAVTALRTTARSSSPH
jgi:hypothetical protein